MDMLVVFDYRNVLECLITTVSSFIFIVLCFLILMDIVTGKIKALIFGDVDSSVGTNGLIKHSLVIIINVFVGVFVFIIQAEYLGYLFISFYILEYVVSIIENLDTIGVPFPEPFRRYFRRLREEHSETEIGKGD